MTFISVALYFPFFSYFIDNIIHMVSQTKHVTWFTEVESDYTILSHNTKVYVFSPRHASPVTILDQQA